MKNIYADSLKTERVINLCSSENIETGTVFRSFLVRFPKILLAELNTHRMLVRNCGSSRAIPTSTFIKNIKDDPYVPIFTGLKAGMIGIELEEDSFNVKLARALWSMSRGFSLVISKLFHKLNIHKQNANRVLEPYTYVDLVLSGTEWDNLLHLRCALDAQPDFKIVADKIAELIRTDVFPRELKPGQWHVPFIDTYHQHLTLQQNIQVAIARIARVSYMRHGSDEIELEKDIALAKTLSSSGHLSPLEHVARAVSKHEPIPFVDRKLQPFMFYDKDFGIYRWTRQYSGFYTYRHHIEDGVPL